MDLREQLTSRKLKWIVLRLFNPLRSSNYHSRLSPAHGGCHNGVRKSVAGMGTEKQVRSGQGVVRSIGN